MENNDIEPFEAADPDQGEAAAPTPDPDEDLRAAERDLADELSVVPATLRSILPPEIRLWTVGHHVLVTDVDGNRWISVSSHAAFTAALHGISPRPVVWVVITPQLSLSDSAAIMGMLRGSPPSGEGRYNRVPFIIKNMPRLRAKVQEHSLYSNLMMDLMAVGSATCDSLMELKTKNMYKDLLSLNESMTQEHARSCYERKARMVLSMYNRDYLETEELGELFGPHNCIQKLLPDVHRSIYVGPEKFDPCYRWINNTDEQKLRTQESLAEAMEALLLEFPDFNESATVDHYSLLLLKAEGQREKYLELAGAVGSVVEAVS